MNAHDHMQIRSVKGLFVYTPLFMVKKAHKGGKFVCSVVVSKKIAKSAVVRNAIRRRVYEAVRLCIQKQHPSFGVYVFQIKSIPISYTTQMIVNEVQKALYE